MPTQVPPDSDARILSEHAVVARGAAGSRAVGAVADDPVVGVALRARAAAPGVSTDVAALRARGLYENTLFVYAADNGGVDDGRTPPRYAPTAASNRRNTRDDRTLQQWTSTTRPGLPI